jgi:hypothetical protein
LVRELTVVIDDELEKEMSRYPEVDWGEVVRKEIRKWIVRKDIFKIYDDAVESALAKFRDVP